MRHALALIVFYLIAIGSVAAQIVDASVCEILANPQSFDGKIVRVKGVASAGFDDFAVKEATCSQSINGIWLAYPEGTKGKAGPAALLELQLARNNDAPVPSLSRSPVKLDKNKDFKQFDSLLSTPYKTGGMCLGCIRYTATATIVGRLDGVKDAGIVRNSTGKVVSANGFGNLDLYPARLVVQSVSDVAAHEIDYSKISSLTKDDSVRESNGDPVAAAHQAARAFGADTEPGKDVERAAAAYGKEGEDNGVNLGFGVPNEVPKSDGPKGDKNSPDGVLFNCTFDTERLKGEMLGRAIANIGTHIADLRDPQSTTTPKNIYDLESHAWQVTVLNAIAVQQKTLTLPGGYLVWNSAWPTADRGKLVDAGIENFLREWVALKH
jgi:hypothetical protein